MFILLEVKEGGEEGFLYFFYVFRIYKNVCFSLVVEIRNSFFFIIFLWLLGSWGNYVFVYYVYICWF